MFVTLHKTSYLTEVVKLIHHIREGEGGAGAVSSGAGSACVLLAFMLACFSRCARVLEGKSTWDAF